MLGAAVLLKGLIAAVVVGFVTASIKTWIDRFFLVIMLVGIVGLPIGEAILVNLVVISLSALLMVIRQRRSLQGAAPVGGIEWYLIVLPAIAGALVGRLVSAAAAPRILLASLGVYAILVGLRLIFIQPLPERGRKAPAAWLLPVGLGSGFLAGFLSAGAKPFAVPVYNNVMGHQPQRAYAFASLGVASAAWAALATQIAFVAPPSGASLLLAGYEFALVTLVALLVGRFWSPRLNRIVNLSIAPVLILAGLRFLLLPS